MIATFAPVIAHAGHWLIGLGFGAPAIVIPLGLIVMTIRDRRREDTEAA